MPARVSRTVIPRSLVHFPISAHVCVSSTWCTVPYWSGGDMRVGADRRGSAREVISSEITVATFSPTAGL